MDFFSQALTVVLCIALGVFVGIVIGISLNPTMKDVVTLDNQRCILIYEQDLIHKFCEVE